MTKKKIVSLVIVSISLLVLFASHQVFARIVIDNRVALDGDSEDPSWISGIFKRPLRGFEIGDAIFRDNNTPVPRRLRFLNWAGHCGIYWHWDTEKGDPIWENQITMEAMRSGWWGRLDFGTFAKHNEKKNFWGVGCVTLHFEKRRDLVDIATDETDRHPRYSLWRGYKSPGTSFRCDGFVEWCYEEIGLNNGQGFVSNDRWWSLSPLRQYLNTFTRKGKFQTLTFGKYDDEGEEIYGPIEIEGEDVEPDEDGKYEVYGKEVKVKIYANDIDDRNDGSGITRVQLWVGEPDDTPEDMPGFRIMGDDDDEDYPADHDYIYTWDTTLTIQKDGNEELLFPNGDYTLKTIGFDQAGNKAEAELAVEVANAGKYLYIHIEPSYVETDGSNNDRTGAFDVYVEVWNFGKCPQEGCSPEGCKPKKEGTQSWYYDGGEGKYKQEVCCTNFEVEPSQDTEISGTVVLSPLHPDVNPDSESSGLWKNGWDGTIEITNGVGSVGGVRYRDKDGNSISGRHMVFLVEAGMGGAEGNDLLMINPIILTPNTAGGNDYEGQFRGIRGSFEPKYATGYWGAQSCEPPYGDWGGVCLKNWLPLECGKSYYGGQAGKNTWCAMKLLWAERGWGGWGNLTKIAVAHVFERVHYLLCHLGGEYWPGGGNVHRAMAAQKIRVPYHAIHPDTGEILTDVTCAVALAQFGRVTGGMEMRPIQMYYTPTVTCQTSGVARVIDEEGKDEALTYDFGDVSHIFGSEFIKVEYHPSDAIMPNLFPYGDPPTWWGGWQWVEMRLYFEGQYPQIMVIP